MNSTTTLVHQLEQDKKDVERSRIELQRRLRDERHQLDTQRKLLESRIAEIDKLFAASQ
jgi:hypothetical protein